MNYVISLVVLLFCCAPNAFGQVPPAPVLDTVPVKDTVLVQEILVRDSLDLKYYVVEDTAMYTYEMIQHDITFFETTWPAYVTSSVIGYSEFGLPLRGFKLSKNSHPKPMVFMVGNVHAREDYSSKMTMKIANVMLLSLVQKTDLYPNVPYLLDSVDIYFLPVANPDGLKIAQLDFHGIGSQVAMWEDSIKVDETYTEWKANGLGIDLNCSFDDGHWDVKKGGNFHAYRASEGYKGTVPAEASETKALQHFVQQNKPICTLSFHTKGNILYWADALTHDFYEGIDTEMANEAQKGTPFTLGKMGTKPSDFGAGLENYVRSRAGSIGVCVELSCGGGGRKQHADSLFNSLVWNVAWQIPVVYLENTVQHKNELVRIQQAFYAKLEEDKP